MLVDSHAHIYSEYYESIEKVLDNAKKNNVLKIINCSTSINNFDEVINISHQYNLYYSLGIHPEEISELKDNYKDILEKRIIENLDDKNFVAIGEIGLDYYYSKDDKDKQRELFEFQMYLSEKYNKPVIIHSREATKDTLEIIKKYNVKEVIHCFSGSFETALEYIKLGFKIGIGGLVTFKNCNLKNYIEKIGLENIILETDSPYMTPEPFRGKKNEPSHILDIAKYLSDVFNISLEKLEEITTKNCCNIFDID